MSLTCVFFWLSEARACSVYRTDVCHTRRRYVFIRYVESDKWMAILIMQAIIFSSRQGEWYRI